jgi:hypothetical protein
VATGEGRRDDLDRDGAPRAEEHRTEQRDGSFRRGQQHGAESHATEREEHPDPVPEPLHHATPGDADHDQCGCEQARVERDLCPADLELPANRSEDRAQPVEPEAQHALGCVERQCDVVPDEPLPRSGGFVQTLHKGRIVS